MYHEGPSKTSYYNVDLDSNPPLSPAGTNMLDSQSPLSSTVIDVALQKIFCVFPITCNKNWYEHLEKSLKMRHMFFYIVNNHVISKMIFISKTYGNQRLSPLMLWVRISIRAKCTTLCDKVCQWLATGGFLRVLRFPPPIKLTATI